MDKNFENQLKIVVKNIIKEEDINISQYEYIYFRFDSKIIDKLFQQSVPNIQRWHNIEENDILSYCVIENGRIEIFHSYCSSQCNNNNTFIQCKACNSQMHYGKPCLIINIDEKYFYKYFSILFNNLKLRTI